MPSNNTIHRIGIRVRKWRIFGKKISFDSTQIKFDTTQYTFDQTAEILQ